MTEEQKAKIRAQKREFPETMEIMVRIRGALAERLFKTAVNAHIEREELFLRVQTIDAMMGEMESLLANSAGGDAIEEYAKQFATTAEK